MNAARIPTMASNLDADDEKRALTACAMGEAHREASFRRMLRIGGGAALIAIGLIFLILGISGAGADPAQPAPAGSDSSGVAAVPPAADSSDTAVADTSAVSASASGARGPHVSLLTGLLIGLISLALGAAGIYFGLQIGAPAIDKVERGHWRFFVHHIGSSGRGLADVLSCSEHNHSKVAIFELPAELPTQPLDTSGASDQEIAVVSALATQKKALEAVEVRSVANAFISDESLLAEVATLAERAALGQTGADQPPEALATLSQFAAQQEQTQQRLQALGTRIAKPTEAVASSLKAQRQQLAQPSPPSAGALPKLPVPGKHPGESALAAAVASLQAEIAPQTAKLQAAREKSLADARETAEAAKKKAGEALASSGAEAAAEEARKAHAEAKQAAGQLEARQVQKQAKEKELEQLKSQPVPAEAEEGAPDNLARMAALQGEITQLQTELAGLEPAREQEQTLAAALKKAEQALEEAKKQHAAAAKEAEDALQKELSRAEQACDAAVAQLEEPIEALKRAAGGLLQLYRKVSVPQPKPLPEGILERALAYRSQSLETVHGLCQAQASRLEEVLQQTRALLEKAQLSGQSFPFQSLDIPIYRVHGNFGSAGGSWERTYVPGEYEGMSDPPSFHALPALLQRVRSGLSGVGLAMEELGA